MRPTRCPPGTGRGLDRAGQEEDRCAAHFARGVCRVHARGEGGRPASSAGRSERRGCGWPYPPARLQAELAADAAEQVGGVDAELLELVAVLLGVDLVGQLLLGLLDLVVGAALTQQLKDLVLGDLHGCSLGGVEGAGTARRG